MPNLEHERAMQAHQCILELEALSDEDKKKYRALVQRASPLIHHTGLFQTLGFFLQKKKNHHLQLANHILSWILPHVPSQGQDIEQKVHNLYFQHLLQSPDAQSRYQTAETQAFILWLKRFAVARLPEPDQDED